jgi:hypothetical protein
MEEQTNRARENYHVSFLKYFLSFDSNKTRWLDRQIYNFILRHGLGGRWVMIKQLTAHVTLTVMGTAGKMKLDPRRGQVSRVV